MDLVLLVVLLVFVLPGFGWFRFRRLSRMPFPVPARTKFRLYASAVAAQWSLTLYAAWVLGRRGLGFAGVGLDTIGPPIALAVAGVLAVALVGLTAWSLRALEREPGEPMPDQIRRLARILPLDRREYTGFVPVALTAGFCEEVLYRAALLHAFGLVLPGVVLPVVVAGLVFGGGHAYQGPRGVVFTAGLGIALGFLYVASGSLWPGIGVHAIVDLVNGYTVGRFAGRNLSALAASKETEARVHPDPEAAAPAAFDAPEGAPHNPANSKPAAPIAAAEEDAVDD